MKTLELNQMQNLQGGDDGYCTGSAAQVLLTTGVLFFSVATGGLGAILAAGAAWYLTMDSIGNGACYEL
ncbi:hypothetical protein [Kordia sp.]|uniref:hypothetical protein n=1 Tax=Kordia sp. TaxID=1965332 RepID=UPI003D27EE91